MFRSFYEKLGDNSVAPIIVSLAIMLSMGFLMTRITKKLKLPNVTAYIVTGILIGPFCLDMIPEYFIKNSAFLGDIALAFIAFSTGEYFRLEALKRNGMKVVVITVLEALSASILVFILTYFILGLYLPFSIVISALAAATAPASTVMTIRQTKAKGDFVDTLLQVVALDDVVGLIMYSMAISIAISAQSGEALNIMSVVKPLALNIGVLLLGGAFGALMTWVFSTSHSTDNRLIIALAFLLAFCGICALMDVSPLLGCMSMGTVYINMSNDEKLFMQLGYFSPPLLLLFFVRSGVSFDLNDLLYPSGAIGKTPLLVIGVLYFIVRIIGKYLGAFAGCYLAGKPARTRNYLGLALIPQAGVAIGLAALGARSLGGEMGDALNTIILSSSILYELVGPACAKLSLYLSGSYSNKIEDVVEVSETTEGGEQKSQLELLIERIEKIQADLPKFEENEREKAFTEAARKQFEIEHNPTRVRRRN